MRGHLYWQKTDEIYINVSVRQNLGAVICGDNEGAIWIYDLDPYLDDLHSSSRKKFFVKPIKVFSFSYELLLVFSMSGDNFFYFRDYLN